MTGGTPSPTDPAEFWVELDPLRKVSAGSVFELIEKLRAAGISVRGSRPRRAGLFSRGMVNVTLCVPDKLVIKARKMVADHFAGL